MKPYSNLTIILSEKNLTSLIEESKKYLNQFNEYTKNSSDRFMDNFPNTKQFKITYELISLIDKKDNQSINYIYKILSEELNSLNSNLSSINNLNLAKLIISNNLLIDISDSNKSLHQDIFQFLRKGFINENNE